MKVSVITPMYNCEKFISETIESVLNQTYTNWEMIIIDDCSTDKSKQIAKQYIERDKRIRLIELKENSGAAVARNKGIEVSSGRFIAFLDGDDLWESLCDAAKEAMNIFGIRKNDIVGIGLGSIRCCRVLLKKDGYK